MAIPFNPPDNESDKPFVPQWIPPQVTKEKHNFAELKSIDLSLLDSDNPAVVDNLIQKVKVAIRHDGFLFLENYGVSLEQVSCPSNITSDTDSAAPSSIRYSTVPIQQHQRGRQRASFVPPRHRHLVRLQASLWLQGTSFLDIPRPIRPNAPLANTQSATAAQ